MGVGTFRIGHAGAVAKQHNSRQKKFKRACTSPFLFPPFLTYIVLTNHYISLPLHTYDHLSTQRNKIACGSKFITSPTWGQTVDVSEDVMFAWDSSCLNITAADIYLYAPYQAVPLIQMFQNVDFTKGSYNVRCFRPSVRCIW